MNISVPHLHFVQSVLQLCSGTSSIGTLGKLLLGLDKPLRGISELADKPFVVLHVLLTALDDFLCTAMAMTGVSKLVFYTQSTGVLLSQSITGGNHTCFLTHVRGVLLLNILKFRRVCFCLFTRFD